MAINKKIAGLIVNYAEDYQANTFTDEKAKKLTAELVSVQKAEAELQSSFVPKLSKVLPPKKVLRYLQIENKIRAVVKYELAAEIPLVMAGLLGAYQGENLLDDGFRSAVYDY